MIAKNMDCFICFALFCALRKRSPFGNLFSATLVFAHDAKRNSGTTLLPHEVTSLQPLCRCFVAGSLLRVILNGMDECVLKLFSKSCVFEVFDSKSLIFTFRSIFGRRCRDFTDGRETKQSITWWCNDTKNLEITMQLEFFVVNVPISLGALAAMSCGWLH